MSPEQWQRAKTLLPTIVGQPFAEQERHVREAFAGEPEIWPHVLRVARATTHVWATAATSDDAGGPAASHTPSSGEPDGTDPAPEPPLFAPDERCGPYRVVSLIGEGGMGQVFLAHDTRTEGPDFPARRVALKCLRGRWLSSPDARRTLMQEAQGVAAVGSHPNLAALYDIVEARDGQLLVLVMEYIDGSSLSELSGGRRLPWKLALAIGRDIAEGVGHAHDAGVIHCDIKADNVRVTSTNRAKLIDFGLSRARHLPGDQQGRLGTLPYMAPERLLEGELTVAGDIYSLGVTLYELVTGHRPFGGDDELALISSILHDTAPRASTFAVDLPPEVDAVLEKALDKQPARRYQSARELVADLDALLSAREETWGELASRVGMMLVGGLAVLTALGFITTTVFDAGMGRTGRFRQESIWQWPLWGLQSSIMPGVVACGMLLIGALAGSAKRGLTLLGGRRQVRGLAAFSPATDAGDRLGTWLQAALVVQIGVLVGFLVYFSPVMTGLLNFLLPDAAGNLAHLFRGGASDLPDNFRFVLTAIIVVFSLVWLPLALRRRVWAPESPVRSAASAGLVLLALSLALLAVPYRVVHHNASERVCLGGEPCYLAGQSGDDLLLFCPTSAQRKRIVPRGEASLLRTGIVENVFSLFESDGLERCTPVRSR